MTAATVMDFMSDPHLEYGPWTELPKRLLEKGWSEFPYDICWMACSKAGHNIRLRSGWEITLCSAHIKQLDRLAEQAEGYSKAAPPPNDNIDTWPWARWRAISSVNFQPAK